MICNGQELCERGYVCMAVCVLRKCLLFGMCMLVSMCIKVGVCVLVVYVLVGYVLGYCVYDCRKMCIYLWKLYMDMCRDVYRKDCVYMRKRWRRRERNNFYVNGSFWIWQNKQEVDRHILYHKRQICGFIDEYWCFKKY